MESGKFESQTSISDVGKVHEVIGSPPSISVPTHFAKVVLASRPDFSYPQVPSTSGEPVSSRGGIKELAMGAFVLPNTQIPDEADLRNYIVPGEIDFTLLAGYVK